MRYRVEPSRRVLWAGVAAGVALALVVCWGIAAEWWTVGSVDGRWTYPYVRPFSLRPILVFAAIAAGAAALLAIPATSRAMRALLLAWMLFATAALWLVRTTAPFDLEAVFLSPGANSFYALAQERRPGEILARFNWIRRQAPLHAQSNMPGKTILLHALAVVSARTDVLPWLLVILSNLGAVLIFGLSRDLFRDDRTALHAAVLYLFTPARVLFFPLMNAVTPVFVLLLAWLVVRSLRTAGGWYAAAAGVALYSLFFFEPLPLVMGLLFAALGLAAIARGDISLERLVLHVGVMLLVFLAAAVAVYEVTGFHSFRAFRQIGEHAVSFNVAEGRPYGAWVRANLVEFMFAAGPAQLVLAAAAGAAAWRPSERWRDRLSAPIAVLSLGLFAVLIVTDLIGINRGEVIRLWIFLACFFQIPAAHVCAALGKRAALTAVLAVTLLQICLATAAIGFVVP